MAAFPGESESVTVNVGLLVEQAENIMRFRESQDLRIAGFSPVPNGIAALSDRLLQDAYQYLTTQNIDVDYVTNYAQSVIQAKAFFEVARSGILRYSYNTVEI